MGLLADTMSTLDGVGNISASMNLQQLTNAVGAQLANVIGLSTKSAPNPLPFGLPPYITDLALSDLSAWATSDIIKSLRILEITPGKLEMAQGTRPYLFNFIEQEDEFESDVTKMLVNIGSQLPRLQKARCQVPMKFVVDVDSISESLRNDIQGNEFMSLFSFAGSAIRSYEQLAPQQLFPAPTGTGFLADIEGELNKLAEWTNDKIKGLLTSSSLLANLLGGGRVDIPQLWENSTFDQSYTFSIKLLAKRSSDSVWSNIIVPMAHLLTLASPKLLPSNVAYFQPYVIRFRVKNTLFVPAGMITALEIRRGDNGDLFTVYGDLLGLTLSVTLSSLYSVLVNTDHDFAASGNITTQSYLKTLLNISLNTDDIVSTPSNIFEAPASLFEGTPVSNFQGGGGGGTVLSWNKIPADWRQYILDASHNYGVDPALVAAVIQQESSWRPNVISEKGAKGLGQLMPENVRKYGVTNPYDPKQNIDAAAHLLADNFKQTGTVDGTLSMYYSGNATAYRTNQKVSNYVNSVKNYQGQYAGQIR
jgi:hypothetical protein